MKKSLLFVLCAVLTLGATQVTDAGLKELAGMTQMRSLKLSFTQVTDEGLTCLRQIFPKTRHMKPCAT